MSGARQPGRAWADNPWNAAGGRRRYNRERQDQALERRAEVAKLIRANGLGRGAQRRMAAKLQVSESVISRDVRAVLAEQHRVRCPACGEIVRADDVSWSWKPHPSAGSLDLWLVVDTD